METPVERLQRKLDEMTDALIKALAERDAFAAKLQATERTIQVGGASCG
jgi:hypothetical protein